MAAVATSGWPSASQSWHQNFSRSHAHGQPTTMQMPQPEIPLQPRNETDMTREMLITVLTHLSTLIPKYFNNLPVRLVVHGGACMLLHPGLHNLSLQQPIVTTNGNVVARRTTTRDVDYIHRSFVAEWRRFGIPDAAEKLRRCIQLTAQQFRLGADWMNSDADVALPMAIDPQARAQYDPIYTASIQPNNLSLNTIFSSPNGMLSLISVTPFWGVALKLVRYTKWDPGDICLLLRHGTALTSMTWTAELLEGWLRQFCAPMRYTSYDAAKLAEMRARIAHAIKGWEMTVTASAGSSTAAESALAAMGGETAVRTASETRPPPTWMNHASAATSRTRWGPIPQDGRWSSVVDAPQQSHPHAAERNLRHVTSTEDLDRSVAMLLYSERNIPKPRSEMRHDTVVVDSRGAALHPGSAGHIARAEAAVATQSARRKRERKRDKDREKDRSSKWQPQSGSDSGDEDEVNPGTHLHRSPFQIYQPPTGHPPPLHNPPPPYAPGHARTGSTYPLQQQHNHNVYHQQQQQQQQQQHQSHLHNSRDSSPLYRQQQHQSTNSLGLY